MLLVLVLVIWGIIGYKIIATIQPTEASMSVNNFDEGFNPKPLSKVDTFSIAIAYRDPFLGTFQKKHITTDKPKPAKTNTGIVWMPIVYHGTISKQANKPEVFIISINGQQHIMKVGQMIDEVTLITGTNKTVTVTYKGTSKTIEKS